MAREHSTLERIQQESHEWRETNFPPGNFQHHQFLGMVEEVGEIAHAILKFEQQIREYVISDEAKDRYGADVRDGIGDLIIFLMGFCSQHGWSLQDIIEETWDKVKNRDWVADPVSGGE